MQKKVWVTGCCLIIAILALCIWKRFSLQISLKASNFSADKVSYIERIDIDSNGREFAILKTETKQGYIALVHVVKNNLGFWQIERTKVAKDKQGYISIAWVKGAGARRFSHLDNAIEELEWHFAYCGNDARTLIAFSSGQLSENTAVNIQQAGKIYTIHQITVSSEATENNLREILEQNGCVEKS